MTDWVHRRLPWIIGGSLVLAFAISVYAVSYSSDKRRSACQDLEALKTITRNEKQAQVHKITAILVKHKGERRIFGIPRRIWKESRTDTRATIEQLATKDC